MAHHRSAGSLCLDLHRLSLWILAGCLLAEVVLLFLDYHVGFGGLTRPEPLRHLADFARGDGLASWFISVQMVLLGITALAVHRVTAHRDPGSWRALGWLVLALAFIYLAVEDGARLHERVAGAMDGSGSDTHSWIDELPGYTWGLLLLPGSVLLGLFLLVFLWRDLNDAAGRALLLCAVAALMAAAVLHFFIALDPVHPLNLATGLQGLLSIDDWAMARFDGTAYDTLSHFGKTLAVSLEMAGITLLWFVSLRHLAQTAEGILIQVTASD